MKRPCPFLIALGALLGTVVAGRARAFGADAIVVSTATSLRGAFEEVGVLVPTVAGGSRPEFNFGASGDLVAQIRGGAPVDVFAAAAAKDMDALEAEGLLLSGTRVDFAANEIVVIVPATSSAGIRTFSDLAKREVARVAIGNPGTAPAGRYASEVFASLGITGPVRPKLVLAENVRQVLDYVARGEVDAGVVYTTDAALRPREVTVAASAPAGSHQPVSYTIAVLKASKQPQAGKAFVAALCSQAGLAILARHGFQPAPAAR
jgi:molybdate transport system substrate-binding protein